MFAIKHIPPDPHKLAIPTSTGLQIFDLNDIILCQSSNSYTQLFLSEGKAHLVCRSIKKFEELLAGKGFFRVHNSHLVNLSHISEVIKESGTCSIVCGGKVVPVSRRKWEAFLGQLEQVVSMI